MYRRSIAWQDITGDQRLTLIASTAGAPNTHAALIAATYCDWQNWFEGVQTPMVPATNPAGQYPYVGQMAALEVTDGFAAYNRILIPAPEAGLLAVDGQTIMVTGPLWGPLATALQGELVVPYSAMALNAVLGGWMLRRTGAARETYYCSGAFPTMGRDIVWMDVAGGTTLTRLVSEAGAPNSMAAIDTVSAAGVLAWWEGDMNVNGLFAPGSGVYASVLDYADLVFSDGYGGAAHIILPAPLSYLFEYDAETINPTVPAVAAIITAVLVECVAPASGQPLTNFVGGRRRRRRQQGVR